MSRMRRIVQGAFLSGGAVFVSMVAMLAVVKMVSNAHSLSLAEAAIFMTLLLCADFFNILNNFGLWVALPKLVAAADGEKRMAIVASSMSIQAFISVALGVVVLGAWWFLPPLETMLAASDWMAIQPYCWILPPLFIVGTLRDNAMAALAGLNCYGRRAVGIVVSSLMQIVLVYVFVWRMQGGIATLLCAMLASYTLALTWLYVALPVGKRPTWDWKTYGASAKFSRPLYVHSLLNFFFQRFDTVLVIFMLGLPAGGVYEMIKSFPKLLSRSLGALRVPFLPNISEQISRGDSAGASRLLNRALIMTAFVGNIGVLVTVLTQEWLITLLLNAEYLEGTAVLGLLMGAICLAVQAGFFSETLIALGRPMMVTVANFGMAGITIAVSVALLLPLGMQGAGIGWLCGVSFSTAIQAYFVRKGGIRLDLHRFVKIQVIMLMASLLILLGGAGIAYRAGALIGFVVLCFGVRIIDLGEVTALTRALVSRK